MRVFAVLSLIVLLAPFANAATSPNPEVTRVSEIASMLPEKAQGVLPSIDDRAAWERIAKQENYRDAVKKAESLLKQPIPDTTDALYLEFSKNGIAQGISEFISIESNALEHSLLRKE